MRRTSLYRVQNAPRLEIPQNHRAKELRKLQCSSFRTFSVIIPVSSGAGRGGEFHIFSAFFASKWLKYAVFPFKRARR